ncbi:hypothetical protein [Kosakonia radicincitans]|uniref:hypothetical protein n=1 Tax=Kosakonia radicincitans TaxID=283686 RepID=UPI0031DC69FE
MLSLLKSFRLQLIRVERHLLDFNSEHIPEREDINLAFSLGVRMQDDKEANVCNLHIMCVSKINDLKENEENPFSLELGISYKFKIIDSDTFYALQDEERAELLSNMVFLQFRRKLMSCFADAGLSSIKFPLSFDKMREFSAES